MIHHKLTPAKRKSLTIDEVLERLENVSENGDGWRRWRRSRRLR